MGKINDLKQMKNIFQSRIMLGMIISLSMSVLLMAVMSIVMFVFAGTNETIYFSWGINDGSYEDRLNYSNRIIIYMGVFDIILGLFKFVDLFAAFGVYKNCLKSIGFTIIKVTSIFMSILCSIVFVVLFIGAFVSALTSSQEYKMEAFKTMIVPAITFFFPTLKFISLSVTITSLKKQLANGVLLLIISTAVLMVCDFIALIDTLTYIEYYSVISLNAASVFLVFSVIDVFIFLMAKNYVQTQVS